MFLTATHPSGRTNSMTQQENKVLEAAYAYADALAVLRGTPPFSVWDALKIEVTRSQLLSEVAALSTDREPGPSIPDGSPAPPELAALVRKFIP
jgi:hypothetical protein